MYKAHLKRPMSKMKKLETKEALFRARKRILKYLVLGYLKQEGFSNSADAFIAEADVTTEFELCDNIDLDIILQDYCNYYLARFDKQPQFCRRAAERPPPPLPRRPPRKGHDVGRAVPCREPDVPVADLPAAVGVTKLLVDNPITMASPIATLDQKPLTGFLVNISAEKKQLAEQLYLDIVRPSDVTWDDVKGLDEAKSLLMEAVVYPVKYPNLFTGLLEPWRGILLHGPPGTGKTLLARAVASESSCTFFNVSCSSVVNKWRGESEKIVRVLFEMASYYSPSIIFIDEVETLASERAVLGEHEASRRLKAQLLTEMDGIERREGIVFLLANSNMPWEIDPAMLRRLEKRIHIPLPDLNTRTELFEKYLISKTMKPQCRLTDIRLLGAKTEGYSGSEIRQVCKEALMVTVRKMLPNMAEKSKPSIKPSRPEELDLVQVEIAIRKTKPVSKNLAQKHIDWQNQMGCS